MPLGLFEYVETNWQEIINIIHMTEKLMRMRAKKSVVHFLNNWTSVYLLQAITFFFTTLGAKAWDAIYEPVDTEQKASYGVGAWGHAHVAYRLV